MKKFLLCLATSFILMGGLGSCGSNDSKNPGGDITQNEDNNNNNNQPTVPSKPVETISGDKKIKNHLDKVGRTEFNIVSTGGESTLGYKNDNFFLGNTQNDGKGLVTNLVCMFKYGDPLGVGTFSIKMRNLKVFEMSIGITTEYHNYKTTDVLEITLNEMGRLEQETAKAIAGLCILSCKDAISNANSYLVSNDLPYIW